MFDVWSDQIEFVHWLSCPMGRIGTREPQLVATGKYWKWMNEWMHEEKNVHI